MGSNPARLFSLLQPISRAFLIHVPHGGETLLVYLFKYAQPCSLMQSKLNMHGLSKEDAFWQKVELERKIRLHNKRTRLSSFGTVLFQKSYTFSMFVLPYSIHFSLSVCSLSTSFLHFYCYFSCPHLFLSSHLFITYSSKCLILFCKRTLQASICLPEPHDHQRATHPLAHTLSFHLYCFYSNTFRTQKMYSFPPQ